MCAARVPVSVVYLRNILFFNSAYVVKCLIQGNSDLHAQGHPPRQVMKAIFSKSAAGIPLIVAGDVKRYSILIFNHPILLVSECITSLMSVRMPRKE